MDKIGVTLDYVATVVIENNHSYSCYFAQGRCLPTDVITKGKTVKSFLNVQF